MDETAQAPQRARRVAVVVLTWRGYAVTRDCLESLTRTEGWPFPVLVVDNGSDTGEGQQLEAEFGPPVSALALPSNGGVGVGYGAGIRWAQTSGASHALLLNNDTICSDPGLIARLLAAAAPDVAVVGPLVRGPDGSCSSAGGTLRWPIASARHLRIDDIATHDAPYDVAWVDGSCMLVSLEAVERIGSFTEEYFMYWEEVDWCVRARRAGYRCLVEPRTSIVHLGSISVTSEMKLRQWMRNRILFMRRNSGWSNNATTLVTFVLFTIPSHMVREGVRPRGWLRVLSAAWTAMRWNVQDAARRGSWLIRDPLG